MKIKQKRKWMLLFVYAFLMFNIFISASASTNIIDYGTWGIEVTVTGVVEGPNTQPTISNPNPNNGSSDQSLSFSWSCTIEDLEGDVFNWSVECNNSQTNNANGENNGTKSLSLSGLSYSTTYTVWVNATDNDTEYTREYYTFTTIDEGATPTAVSSGTWGVTVYIEYYVWTEWSDYWYMDYINFNSPTNFVASNWNNSVINLSWTKDTNTTHTYIERNTIENWNIGNGEFVYNDTGNSYDNINLGSGTHYYYRAWSYNSSQNLFSDANATDDDYTNPSDPSDFISTDKSMNTIDLQWTKGTNATNTVVVMNETGYANFPNSVINGTIKYNDTDSSGTIAGLSINTSFYFSAWSFNPDSGYFSDSYVSTNESTVATADTPTSLVAVTDNDTIIELSWAKGDPDDDTVIRRNTGSYPTLSTGTEIYNGTAELYSDTGLTPAIHYYYRAWGWNGEQFSGGYSSANNITLPEPPQMLVGTIDGTTLTITWEKGVGAVRTVLRNDTTGYPTLSTGTLVYNGTGTQKIVTDVTTIDYYRGWSYALVDGQHLYSEGTNLLWGGLEINAYKQADPSISILNYTVFITNSDGSETFQNTSQNNPTRIDVSDVPNGVGIRITISKDGYYPSTRIETLLENAWYTLDFYLVASPEGGGNPDEPDYIPPDEGTNESENETYAYLYLLIVEDEYSIRVPDVTVAVKKYINTSDSWEIVTDAVTDGNGQAEAYLLPHTEYLFSFSKTGFVTQNVFWTPTSDVFSHTFKIYHSNETEPEETLFTNLTYSITPTTTNHTEAINISFTVNDTNCLLSYYQMVITYNNLTNNSDTTLVAYNYNETNITCGGTLYFITNNSDAKYTVTIYIKKQGFSEFFTTKIYYVHPSFPTPWTISDLIPEILYWIVAVVVSLLATAFAYKLVGSGSIIVSLIVFGLFVAINPSGSIAGIPIFWILILMGIVTAVLFMLGKIGGDNPR